MPEGPSIVDHIRARRLDTELAALLWVMATDGVTIHVVSEAGDMRTAIAEALRTLAADPALVSDGPGGRIEDVLRQPVPIRPPTGVVVVVDESARVAAAHLHRPPLRDAAGHVQPQRPAVLVEWNPQDGRWEHYTWGVMQDLVAGTKRKAGDVEADIAERASVLGGLAAMPPGERSAVESVLKRWPDQALRAH